MAMIEITERFLSDAGGWQALKQARALHELGRVMAASYVPPLLDGRVREGEIELRSGLRILSRSNVENLCGCRASRRDGVICAHSLAVGLEFIKPRQVAKVAPAATPTAVAKPTRGPHFSLEEGEQMELSLVLPMNLLAGWEKDLVIVGVEVEVSGRRVLASALDRNRTFRAPPQEIAILEKLRTWNGGELPGMPGLSREMFVEFLALAAGKHRVTFGKARAATISNETLRPRLAIDQAPDGTVHLRVEFAPGAAVLIGKRPWLLDDERFQPLAADLPPSYHDLLRREIVLPPDHANAFLRDELSAFAQWFSFDLPAFASGSAVEPAGFERPAFQLKIEGSLNHLAADLNALYGDGTVNVTCHQTGVGSRSERVRRNPAAEQGALSRLREAGFTSSDADGKLVMKGEPRIVAFFARDLPRLQRDWQVTIGARFEHVTRDIDRIQPRLEVRNSGQNWFELEVELSTSGGERFSAAEIQRLLQSGQSSIRLKNKKLAVFDPGMLDELQQVLTDCNPQQPRAGLYRIEQRHAAYLHNVASDQGTPINAAPEWRELASAARSLDEIAALEVGDLTAVLRPYQQQGVKWLNFLLVNRFGGILADEMGLGKTLQTLAFLRASRKRALVVCPASLVFNWQREAERFTPELAILAMHGAARVERFSELAKHDLVITSYPLLRRDLEQYRSVEFDVAVLDEAQHIKNPETQNAQAAYAVRAPLRVVLTGTPVENSVRDLWSLMNFAMPGYLGSRSDFRERYEKEIESQPGGPAHQRLSKRLRPFLLRRLKSAVAKELPEKLEQVAYCELNEAQQTVYSELVHAARRTLSELAGGKEAGKSRIVALTALLRLRQACCDLRLLNLEQPNGTPDSAKIALFRELVQEAIDGEHRVLVFSQFVSMLKLLRGVLEEENIPFCYLDGATRNRGAEVERFQAGETPIFLISLKAGGTGLNLTAADTVIHFDPWWNPAVEAQATDRAHRIGQKKVVTSYKLITRNTVEEKILALQLRKRDIIAATLESEQPLMDALSMDELRGLLE